MDIILGDAKATVNLFDDYIAISEEDVLIRRNLDTDVSETIQGGCKVAGNKEALVNNDTLITEEGLLKEQTLIGQDLDTANCETNKNQGALVYNNMVVMKKVVLKEEANDLFDDDIVKTEKDVLLGQDVDIDFTDTMKSQEAPINNNKLKKEKVIIKGKAIDLCNDSLVNTQEDVLMGYDIGLDVAETKSQETLVNNDIVGMEEDVLIGRNMDVDVAETRSQEAIINNNMVEMEKVVLKEEVIDLCDDAIVNTEDNVLVRGNIDVDVTETRSLDALANNNMVEIEKVVLKEEVIDLCDNIIIKPDENFLIGRNVDVTETRSQEALVSNDLVEMEKVVLKKEVIDLCNDVIIKPDENFLIGRNVDVTETRSQEALVSNDLVEMEEVVLKDDVIDLCDGVIIKPDEDFLIGRNVDITETKRPEALDNKDMVEMEEVVLREEIIDLCDDVIINPAKDFLIRRNRDVGVAETRSQKTLVNDIYEDLKEVEDQLDADIIKLLTANRYTNRTQRKDKKLENPKPSQNAACRCQKANMANKDERPPCDGCSKTKRRPPLTTDKGNHRYKCRKCGKSCTTKQYLAVHNLLHTVDKSYDCRLCSRTFLSQYNLSNHKGLAHGSSRFTCDVCDFVETSRQRFVRHMRRHPQSVMHKPKITETGFRQWMEQQTRIQIRSDNSCQLCRKYLGNKREVRKHMKVHKNLMVECEVCSKVFSRYDSLARHVRTQHLLKCYICQKTFPTTSLNAHLRTAHTSRYLECFNAAQYQKANIN